MYMPAAQPLQGSVSHHLLTCLLSGFVSPEQYIALTSFYIEICAPAVFAYIPSYTRIPFFNTHTELVET